MNATASESKQSTIYSSSILVMWTISPHPAAPMGGFSWKPLKARECISTNFSLAQTVAVKQRPRVVALSRPSIYLTVCLSASSSSQWLFPVAVWPCACPPRGGGTLGPLTYPRSGSRVEWVREGGKKNATTALWVGSASFTEVSQNKSGSHYVGDLVRNIKKQHLATSTQAALYNPTEKKK